MAGCFPSPGLSRKSDPFIYNARDILAVASGESVQPVGSQDGVSRVSDGLKRYALYDIATAGFRPTVHCQLSAGSHPTHAGQDPAEQPGQFVE